MRRKYRRDRSDHNRKDLSEFILFSEILIIMDQIGHFRKLDLTVGDQLKKHDSIIWKVLKSAENILPTPSLT